MGYISDINTDPNITEKRGQDNVYFLAGAMRETSVPKVRNLLADAASAHVDWLRTSDPELKAIALDRAIIAKREAGG